VIDRRNAFERVAFTRMLGVRRELAEGGRSRLVLDAGPDLHNPVGSVHGGVVATLLDVAMASAALSHVDFEKTAITLNMNVSYLHPGHGHLVTHGHVIGVEDGIAACRARVVDEAGRLVAQAHGSFRYVAHRAPDATGGDA